MNQYRRGRAIEYLLIHKCRRAGYSAMRSAGSKGVFDVHYWNATESHYAQCALAGVKTKKDFEAMRNTPVPPKAQREMWEYQGRGKWKLTLFQRGKWKATLA